MNLSLIMGSIGVKITAILLFFNLFVLHAQADINQLDEKGKKQGLWKGFYEDTKNQKFEGTFDHGKEVGIFYFFDNTKKKTLIATRTFNDKDNSAYTIFYDVNKNIVSEGNVVNKLFEGQWKYYHKASKNIMTRENYSKGKKEGVSIVYYPNGKIAEESIYKNDLKNGAYKRYTEGGIIIEESYYQDDVYDGPAIFRDSGTGDVVSKGVFVKGKKMGVWQFYEKGKLVKEMNMSFPQKGGTKVKIQDKF